MKTIRAGLVCLAIGLVGGAAVTPGRDRADASVPLVHWSAPPYWSGPSAESGEPGT